MVTNFIINGSLHDLATLNIYASSGNGANNYTADRFWVSHNNSSNVTVSRQDGTGAGIGVQYCARVLVAEVHRKRYKIWNELRSD